MARLGLTPEKLDELPLHRVGQDPPGTLWIATDRGLFPDDGRRLRVYWVGSGLESNLVTAVHAARDEVFVQTMKGRLGGDDAYAQRLTVDPLCTNTYSRRLRGRVVRWSPVHSTVRFLAPTAGW